MPSKVSIYGLGVLFLKPRNNDDFSVIVMIYRVLKSNEAHSQSKDKMCSPLTYLYVFKEKLQNWLNLRFTGFR